jgi:hypothetical protein
MLPFTLLLCAIAWSLRYMPFPIKNSFIRVPVQLFLGFGIGALGAGQLFVFRSMAGIKGELFRNDNLSFIIVVIGHLIGLWLVFNSVKVGRKRQQSAECKSEKIDSHPLPKS